MNFEKGGTWMAAKKITKGKNNSKSNSKAALSSNKESKGKKLVAPKAVGNKKKEVNGKGQQQTAISGSSSVESDLLTLRRRLSKRMIQP
jgi:hypothetical protein